MAWALRAAARGISREQIEHEILNSPDLSKKGPQRPVRLRGADRCQGDRSLRAIEKLSFLENPL
jgi:hypothetical protein